MPKLSPVRNPLVAAKTQSDFLARWPGASCKRLNYDNDLSVYVLRLSNGMFVGACSNANELWDRAYALLDKGCMKSQRRASRFTGPEGLAENESIGLRSERAEVADIRTVGGCSLHQVGPLIGALT